jgi:plasmid stabilization system protein ParE
MAHEIVFKKRFLNKLVHVLTYLESKWGKNMADEFLVKVDLKIQALSSHPYIGSPTKINNVRGVLITKHNRMYYKVTNNKIVIINLFDTRRKNYSGSY